MSRTSVYESKTPVEDEILMECDRVEQSTDYLMNLARIARHSWPYTEPEVDDVAVVF